MPLHYKMYHASQKGRDFDLTGFTEGSLVERYPANAVTFVDNHDSQRGSSLESQIKDWFKPLAYGMILLMKEGYPWIFYGDCRGIARRTVSPHRAVLDILLDARRKYAYGEQDGYFDRPNPAGFVRRGDAEHPGSGLALLVSNGEDGEKTMFVGKERRGERWREITGCVAEETTIGDDGRRDFHGAGLGEPAVWVRE